MSEMLALFFVFFKVGLFTIGGGLAAIPLLQSEVLGRGWITATQLTDMIAVSESTPGPIGVNMATFVGFSQSGVLGSVVATLGLVTPSVVIILIIARYLFHFNDNIIVLRVLSGLRPAVTGLIASAAFSIALLSIFNLPEFQTTGQLSGLIDYKALLLCVVLFFTSNRFNWQPIFCIVFAGLLGIILF